MSDEPITLELREYIIDFDNNGKRRDTRFWFVSSQATLWLIKNTRRYRKTDVVEFHNLEMYIVDRVIFYDIAEAVTFRIIFPDYTEI